MGSSGHAIATERYVSLTTYRRSGEPVHTAVWIADLGDGTAGFTTGPDSGKVKRIRANGSVAVRPCDVRGRVPEGATEVTATAAVRLGADAAPVRAAIKEKYGLQFRMIELSEWARGLLRRKDPVEECAIVLRFEPGPGSGSS